MHSPKNSDMNTKSRARTAALLAMLFIVGFVLMGFEMLGSRYLNPYFGGGITTWACLISVVLLAMMIGYFSGGYAADHNPGVMPLATILAVAGSALLIVAYAADGIINSVMWMAGDGFWGALLASVALVLIPVGLLSACSPYVVRLSLTELRYGGRVTGLVYSVSTFGNVIGTLATTFWLIPQLGTRTITKVFAAILIGLALVMAAYARRLVRREKLIVPLVALALAGIPFGTGTARGELRRAPASYPEGPLWVGDTLLYAEMGRDRITSWRGGKIEPFWQDPGCGPTAITRYRKDMFAVNCHLSGRVAILDSSGVEVLSGRKIPSGVLRNPNDINADGSGGVYFSDPGPFSSSAPAQGVVYRLLQDGRLVKIRDQLKYPNGVAYDKRRRILYVCEHLARRVWAFKLGPSNSISSATIFLTEEDLFAGQAVDYAEAGPDGIRIDSNGDLYIAIYGTGQVLVVAADGRRHRVRVPMKFVTSIAVSSQRVAVVGAFDNRRHPFPGEVLIVDKANFLGADHVGFN